MVEGSLGLIVEGLVCVLLVASIYYSISVNRKIERLRNEQKGMQSFIRELSIATANADKAIQGLRQTVEASGNELAGQIEKGRGMTRTLKNELEKAEHTMNRLVVLAGGAARNSGLSMEQPVPVAPASAPAPAAMHAQAPVAAPTAMPVAAPAAPQGSSVEELRRRMMGFDDLEQTADASLIDEELVAAAAGRLPQGGKVVR